MARQCRLTAGGPFIRGRAHARSPSHGASGGGFSWTSTADDLTEAPRLDRPAPDRLPPLRGSRWRRSLSARSCARASRRLGRLRLVDRRPASPASRTRSSPIDAARPPADPPRLRPLRRRAHARSAGGAPQRSAAEVETPPASRWCGPNGAAAPGARWSSASRSPRRQAVPRRTPAWSSGAGTGCCRRSARTAPGPRRVYARPAGAPAGGARPAARIAILVTGLGISQSATAGAIAGLPAAVTLAFAPYGDRPGQARGARRASEATRSCSRCRWSRSTIRTAIPGRTR